MSDLQLLVGHALAQLLGDPLEVGEGDLARLVVVEELEGLEDLLAGVLLGHLAGHERQEMRRRSRPNTPQAIT